MTAAAIGDRFAELLRASLTPAEFAEMKHLNETDPTYRTGCCASQNYCDANMPMAEAFAEIAGHEVDGDNDDDAALWNAAWQHARKHHLGAPQ